MLLYDVNALKTPITSPTLRRFSMKYVEGAELVNYVGIARLKSEMLTK